MIGKVIKADFLLPDFSTKEIATNVPIILAEAAGILANKASLLEVERPVATKI